MPSIRLRMSSVAVRVCLASSLTSVATTANPLPASPARAASIVAFRREKIGLLGDVLNDFDHVAHIVRRLAKYADVLVAGPGQAGRIGGHGRNVFRTPGDLANATGHLLDGFRHAPYVGRDGFGRIGHSLDRRGHFFGGGGNRSSPFAHVLNALGHFFGHRCNAVGGRYHFGRFAMHVVHHAFQLLQEPIQALGHLPQFIPPWEVQDDACGELAGPGLIEHFQHPLQGVAQACSHDGPVDAEPQVQANEHDNFHRSADPATVAKGDQGSIGEQRMHYFSGVPPSPQDGRGGRDHERHREKDRHQGIPIPLGVNQRRKHRLRAPRKIAGGRNFAVKFQSTKQWPGMHIVVAIRSGRYS